MTCHIVEVYGDGRLLQKLNAFDPDLVVLSQTGGIATLPKLNPLVVRRTNKFENTVFLVGLVLLAGYNLFQTDSLLRDIEIQKLFQGLLSLLACLGWLFDRK